jgi:hypothetical protein
MREVIVPAGEGRAVRVQNDEVFRVVDVHGGQVGDLFAFVDGSTVEWMSAEHTRPSIRRLFPRPGDVALTNHRREILRVEEDRSPGWHDTLYAACDPARYARLGFEGPHRSCATNLVEAMPGLGEPVIPQPFNLFMHVDVGPKGALDVVPATSQPGDFISFRALLDIIVVVSSCPMDLVDISTGGVTALRIEIG